MTEARRVETFNTHRMTDEAIRAVATGRDDEVTEIMSVIQHAAEAPLRPMPALIVYGERGSGKSFLMRLVEIECAALADKAACVLLPEEQYSIHSSTQLPRIVAARIRGGSGTNPTWQFDDSEAHHAWDGAVSDMHAALDARFGIGQGIVIVVLENFDILTHRLFGARPGKGGRARKQSVSQREAEERLRKLMGAPGGRFLLVASATGTVDMDYERPLFQAFKPVDLQVWSPDTAIQYFNRRRALDNAAPLTPAEEARARAIIEFISGNPRLAQLLGNVLGSPSAHTIADTLDQLVDQLADYYRQRMDTLPGKAARILDAMIRGGEPVSQSGLAARMRRVQSQIADSFSFLTRSRIVRGQAERGGASQLYRVRDRLFVHFYRRRYGASHGLAPIAELLEQFFTPEERESQIRIHLERGEFDDAEAFGRLPLVSYASDRGFCRFRDLGVEFGLRRVEFQLVGALPHGIDALQAEMRDEPLKALKRWTEGEAHVTTPLQLAATSVLRAVAASRSDLDQMASKILTQAVDQATENGSADALIVAKRALAMLLWHRADDIEGSLAVLKDMQNLAVRAAMPVTGAMAWSGASFYLYYQRRYETAESAALHGLGLRVAELTRPLLEQLIFARMQQSKTALALEAIGELLAQPNVDPLSRAIALSLKSWCLRTSNQLDEAILAAQEAAAQAAGIEAYLPYFDAQRMLASAQHHKKDWNGALATYSELERYASTRRNLTGELEAIVGRAQTYVEMGNHDKVIPMAESVIGRRLSGPLVRFHAQALYLKAKGLKLSGRVEEAVDTIGEATKIADAADRDALSWMLLAGGLLVDVLQPKYAARPAARIAVLRYLQLSGRGETADLERSIESVLQVVSVSSWPEGIEAIREAVTAAGDRLPVTTRVKAAAITGDWNGIATFAEGDARWSALQRRLVGGTVGSVWGRMASIETRATAYARIARALPEIDRILVNERADGTDSAGPTGPPARFRFGLVDSFVATCSDSGLLRDVAALFETRYGDSAKDEVARLQSFAEFHAASDREAYLQRTDPDLATAIRRIWNVALPSETSAKPRRARRSKSPVDPPRRRPKAG